MKWNRHVLLTSLVFYFFLVSGSLKVYADLDVSRWSIFGANKQDYTTNGFYASNILGTNDSIDLRTDISYIGYRGNNLKNDISINNRSIDITKSYKLSSINDVITVKKIGIVNGKYIEAKIYPSLVPLKVSINSGTEEKSLLSFQTSQYNLNADNYHIKVRIYYENTSIPVDIKNQYFLLPSTTSSGWKAYIHAMLVPLDKTIVLIGNNWRDSVTRQTARTSFTSSKYKIGIGGAPGNETSYYHNYLFQDNVFDIGIQGSEGFNYFEFGLFDPIDAESSVPKPYDNILFENKSAKDGTIDNQIEYILPKQDNPSFYPETITIDFAKNLKEDYVMTEPELFIDSSGTMLPLVNTSDYTYDGKGKIVLSKNFIHKYSGDKIRINNQTKLDYSSERLVNDYYNTTKQSFEIPYSLKVSSAYPSKINIELDETKVSQVAYPLKFSMMDLNAKVEFNTHSSDYLPDIFLKEATSNIPNDTVEYQIQPILFDTFQEKVQVPVKLTSKKLGITQTTFVSVKVYKNLPVKYQLENGGEITIPENGSLPRKVQQFYDTPISFKVPIVLGSYKFKSIKNQGLSIKELDNKQEISGKLNNNTQEIILVYDMNEISVTIEYLLDSEVGSYETYLPIKEGKKLSEAKQAIKLDVEIDLNINQFIRENEARVIPKIPYYRSHLERQLTVNYWHYTDSPVGKDNPSVPVEATDIIPNRPITITTLYSGTTYLEYIDDMNFGTHKNNLASQEIVSKKPIAYNFIDTTVSKGNELSLRFEQNPLNEKDEAMSAFVLEYNGQQIGNQDVMVVESHNKDDNIFTGDLSSKLLFKRIWLGPETIGEFKGTLVWTLSRDIKL